MSDTIRNAKISSASLGVDSCDGIMSSFIHLDYGGSGQGFGGYALTSGRSLGLWVKRVMEVVGVGEWSALQGKPVRVRVFKGHIEAIGHFIEDKWFYPKVEFEDMEKEDV